MMDEQGTRFEALLEDMNRQLGVLAEASMSYDKKLTGFERTITQRMDALDLKVVGIAVELHDLKADVGRIEEKVDRLEGKVDRLEGKVDRLEGKVDRLEGKVDRLEAFAIDAAPRLARLEAFAADAGPRLVRIETHLALPALAPPKEVTRPGPSKHPRKKPAKRN